MWFQKANFIFQINIVFTEEEFIISQPIDTINLSENFKAMASAQDFHTHKSILNWPPIVLRMHEGFTYHHYQELRNFLIQNDLIHLLKAKK